MQGLYYEECEIGRVIEHTLRRTVTEADNTFFSCMTHNPQPLHIDHDYAAKTEFGKPLVNSALTLAVVTGMTVDDVSFKATANLGWKEIKLTAPVFNGDTIYARSKVLAKRLSKSRPNEGIVTTYTEGYKADGTVFLSFERTSLVPKRGHGPGD